MKGKIELMKKVILFVLFMCLTLILVGCESNDDEKTSLFHQMEKQKIINNGYNQIDIVSICSLETEICKCKNYYVYKNNNSQMIAINFEKNISKYGEHDHVITLYNNVIENSSFNYIEKNEANCYEYTYYKYENGDLTNNNKYDFNDDNKNTYYVTKEKSFFSTKYIFVER